MFSVPRTGILEEHHYDLAGHQGTLASRQDSNLSNTEYDSWGSSEFDSFDEEEDVVQESEVQAEANVMPEKKTNKEKPQNPIAATVEYKIKEINQV